MSTLEQIAALKASYEQTNVSTMLPAIFDALIDVLESLEAQAQTNADMIDDHEVRIANRELCTKYKAD